MKNSQRLVPSTGMITLFEKDGRKVAARHYRSLLLRDGILRQWKSDYGQRMYTMYYQISPMLYSHTGAMRDRVDMAKEYYNDGKSVQWIMKEMALHEKTVRKYLGFIKPPKPIKERVPLEQRSCTQCKGLFMQIQPTQHFCSKKCNTEYHNEGKRRKRLAIKQYNSAVAA